MAVDGCKVSNLLCGKVCLAVVLPLGENDSKDGVRPAACLVHVGGGNSSEDTEGQNECHILYIHRYTVKQRVKLPQKCVLMDINVTVLIFSLNLLVTDVSPVNLNI